MLFYHSCRYAEHFNVQKIPEHTYNCQLTLIESLTKNLEFEFFQVAARMSTCTLKRIELDYECTAKIVENHFFDLTIIVVDF